MNSRAIILFCVIAGLGAGVFVHARSRAMRAARSLSGPTVVEPEKHKVTAEMLRGAEARETLLAPMFRARASDDATHELAEGLKRGPVVLVFIKDGCPCSVSAEGYFNSLHAAYDGRVRFFGVIDGDRDAARAWAARNGVPFPILIDPDCALVRDFRAENSAYVALIDRSGRIDSFWPGYSTAMLEALNARIAVLAGLPEAPIDTTGAPEELYSGCPFR